eukprot:TRINITY_DN4030_c0_g1_i1.p1 TRINITY_DN4030_c0_g1~~TRINITY_DN4030_c0_g1_i1.p1  ORF type:complete len:800 (+),score=137.49 TRINITY_DN4030_c0_g1_i1:357-2756(+)
MSEVEGLSVNYSTMNSNGSCESNLGMSEEGWMTQQAPNQETKVRPHAQAHLLSPTDKCKVCNEPAAKHVHYGAMTCFSCRAFFRRSIQNKTAATYVCRRSKNCEINLKTRKNCQFCRYMRCIAVGMKPTWVLSEEERQRRFRKNREKQEQQGQPGQKKEKKSHSRGNSFSEFNTDFTLDSIESSLTDTLMSSPLLMDQPLPHIPEKSRENIPVILEKQKVVIKNESQSAPADNVPIHIDNMTLNNQFFNDHILKAGPSYQQHILVKTESSSFQPKTKLEPYEQREPKLFQQSNHKGMIAPTTTQPTILLYTSPSQYQQNINTVSTLSPIAQKSTIIVQPTSSGIITSNTYPVTIRNSACLSTSKPHTATASVQNVDISTMRQNYLPTNRNSTPSVIVQPTPRFQQQQQQYHMSNNLQDNMYSSNQHQKLVLQTHPMQEYVPESTFPLEIGSFATIGAEEQISPMHSTYSSTPSPQSNNSTMASSDPSNQNKQLHYKQPEYSQNIQQINYNQHDYGWDSDYENDIFTSDEEDNTRALLKAIANEPEIKFSTAEYNQLENLVKDHDERYRSVNFGEELIKEMIMCSMFGIPVSTSAAINGYRLSVERITRIAHNLDCFTDLPKNDQNNLLKENADLLVNLRGAIFFDSKKKGVDQVLISMGIDDLQTIKTMFTPLLKENSMKHIDYKTFNSIQAVANPATESRYNFLQTKVADLITDDITTILITYIVLFSVDFCPLLDRRRVERTQDVYIRMLERYIYSKTSRKIACSVLARTLNAVTCLREMADIKKSRAINLNVNVKQ